MKRVSSRLNPESRTKMSVNELDRIFISKLSEKYQLTDRDLQKAFRKFDRDGNGYLSLDELTHVIQLYLNGVDSSLIAQLVQIYDTDGDGSISVSEFSSTILSRAHKSASLSSNSNSSSSEKSNQNQLFRSQSTSSIIREQTRPVSTNSNNFDYDDNISSDINNTQPISNSLVDSNSVSYRAKIFLQNMKATLFKKASDMKLQNKIPLHDRLMTHYQELVESIGKSILLKDFKQQQEGTNRGIDYTSFCRVLYSYTYAGAVPPQEDMLKYLFLACCKDRNSVNSFDSNLLCQPDIFVELLFSKTTTEINRFGFTQPILAATELGRPEVAKGPIMPTAMNKIDMDHIPRRMLTKQSHTGLAVPSDFNISQLQLSSQSPSVNISRDFIFGMNTNLQSGRIFNLLPSSQGNDRIILYSVGKVLVIHDLLSEQQIFLEGHTQDITCFSLSQNFMLIASGQMIDKQTCIYIWNNPMISSSSSAAAAIANLSSDGIHNPLLATIGKGFFTRGVGAVAFNFDNSYICGIGSDEKHMLGIWQLSNNELITTISSANGIPPQILHVGFTSTLINTSHISKEHSNRDCDMLVTIGPRHLKFWSFQRPNKLTTSGKYNPSQLLENRSYSMGKIQIDPPKVFQCFDYVYIYDTNSNINISNRSSKVIGCDIVTGGDNGYVYLWRQCVCVATNRIIPKDNGGLNHLIVVGNIIYAGGGNGIIALIDSSTLDILQTYSTLSSSIPQNSSNNNGNSSDGNNTVFSSLGRPQSAIRPNKTTVTLSKPMSSSASRPRSISNTRSRSRTSTSASASRGNDSKYTHITTDILHRQNIPAGAPSNNQASIIRGTKRIDIKDNIKSIGSLVGEMPKPVPSDGIPSSSDVLVIDLVIDPIDGSIQSILALTGYGKVVSIDIHASNESIKPNTLLTFHYGPTYGLAVYQGTDAYDNTQNKTVSNNLIGGRSPFNSFFATGGDDRWLCVWSSGTRELVVRTRTRNAIRAIDFDKGLINNSSQMLGTLCIVIGTTYGFVIVYTLSLINPKFKDNRVRSDSMTIKSGKMSTAKKALGNLSIGQYELVEIVSVRDSKRDISDVKYNREGNLLAVGSHDDIIYIYSHVFEPASLTGPASVVLSNIKRLKGHSSYITHLDWSCDSALLRSTCGAYELLFWDVTRGKQYLNSSDTLESDTLWLTETCVLGFQVMGIWPRDADGTDVNALDVSKQLNLVVTGDDRALVNIFNYPCVTKHAPGINLSGHGSHVQNVKILSMMSSFHDGIVSVGGDGSVMLWTIQR